MTWQYLKYGTLVLAGLTITGTMIYNATQRDVRPVDMIELVEGVNERYCAVHSGAWLSITTNSVQAWANDPSGHTYRIYPGGGAGVITNYLVTNGTDEVVMTNLNNGFSFTYTNEEQVGQWVWSGWDTLTAAGFGALDGISDADGTYVFSTAGEYTGTVRFATYSSNDVYVLKDKGYGSGWQFYYRWVDVADFAMPAVTLPNESFWSTWYQSVGGDALTGVVVQASGINSNHIVGAPALVYTPTISSISRIVSANMMVAIDAAITALAPQFTDTTLTTGTSFEAWYSTNAATDDIPNNTFTGILTRLGIGNGTNFTRVPAWTNDCTNYSVAYTTWYPNATGAVVSYTSLYNIAVNYASTASVVTSIVGAVTNITTNYVWAVVTNWPSLTYSVTNSPTYGAVPWHIYKEDWIERQKVLAELKVTDGTLSWTEATGTMTMVNGETASATGHVDMTWNPRATATTNSDLIADILQPAHNALASYSYDYLFTLTTYLNARWYYVTAKAVNDVCSGIKADVDFYSSPGTNALTIKESVASAGASTNYVDFSNDLVLTSRWYPDVITNADVVFVAGGGDPGDPTDAQYGAYSNETYSRTHTVKTWTFQRCTN